MDMDTTRLLPRDGQDRLADEALACERLLDELLAELTGQTVRALDTRRTPSPAPAPSSASRTRVA